MPCLSMNLILFWTSPKTFCPKSKLFWERSKQLEQVQDSFGSIEGQDIKVQLYKIIWKFENLNASL